MNENTAVPQIQIEGEAPKRVYANTERFLLLIALAIGIILDRTIANTFSGSFLNFYGAFWLVYLAAFHALNWKGLRRNKTLWLIAAFAAFLCLWCIFCSAVFSSDEYAMLTVLVLPCVLMVHAQLFTEDIAPKQMLKLVLAWFAGFFVKPFSAIGRFFGAVGSCIGAQRRPVATSIAIASFISVVLLALIVPILMRADWVFAHYIGKFIDGFDIGSLVGHALIAVTAAVLFYSFLWNSRYKRRWITLRDGVADIAEPTPLVSCIVLCVVIAVYVLFCAVQFTYLFAQAGLPEGMTYSEYAREGFAQIVTICVINLLMYGFFVSGKKESKLRSILLIALLAVTVIILISGAVRLSLYIDAYGMTWLRLISAWFMLYLAAAIVICAVRLGKTRIPAVMACGIALLVWFTVLGYANPDKLIKNYNSHFGYESETVEPYINR